MYRYMTAYNADNQVCLLCEEVAWHGVTDRHNCAHDIWDFCHDALQMDRQTEEYVYCFCYDTRSKLIGFFEISHGTISISLVSPREVFQKALLVGAASIVVVHNHPSQDVSPSHVDREMTARLARAGQLMDVHLTDHVIVAKGRYYSFHETDPAVLDGEVAR